MESGIQFRLRFHPEETFVHLHQYLPRHALLGNNLQLDSHRLPEKLQSYHPCKIACVAGFETHKEKRFPRPIEEKCLMFNVAG